MTPTANAGDPLAAPINSPRPRPALARIRRSQAAAVLFLVTTGMLVPGVASAATPTSSMPTLVVAKSYSMRTVAKHHTAGDCWSVVDGKVYNLTKWVAKHPGGRKRIIRMCGKDASTSFHSQHSDGGRAGAALRRYYIGTLKK